VFSWYSSEFGEPDFIAITEGSAGVSGGVASYSLPIILPPTINNLAPSLALSYSSGSRGSFGVGWNLSGFSSVSRCRANFANEGAEAQAFHNPIRRHTDANFVQYYYDPI